MVTVEVARDGVSITREYVPGHSLTVTIPWQELRRVILLLQEALDGEPPLWRE